MRRHAIITRVGEQDILPIETSSDVQEVVELHVFNKVLPAKKKVKHDYLFGEMIRLGLMPSEVAIDLIFLAISIHAADTRISRAENSQNGWTREIDLYVPVSNSELWAEQAELLETTLQFLTGDIWRIYFRARSLGLECISPIQKNEIPYKTDTACLFSGGLDSFIGSIDLLESDIRPVLVGHSGSSDVSLPQEKCFTYLEGKYDNLNLEHARIHIRAPKEPFDGGNETTTRGRSFLFLALGAAFASALNDNSRLIVPENGLISLNVPLNSLRLGSLSTRTTHPYYMARFQELLRAIGMNVKLENPYRFKTKGEMLKDCKNQSIIEEFAHNTMSCSHPASGRWAKKKQGHCGYCTPCIIRHAAFNAAYGSDRTDYVEQICSRSLDPAKKEGVDVRAFKTALLCMSTIPDVEKYWIHKSGPLTDEPDKTPQFADVFGRGMKEVKNLLDNVKVARVC